MQKKTLLPIQAVARKLDIPEKYFEQWGSQSGKVKLALLSEYRSNVLSFGAACTALYVCTMAGELACCENR